MAQRKVEGPKARILHGKAPLPNLAQCAYFDLLKASGYIDTMVIKLYMKSSLLHKTVGNCFHYENPKRRGVVIFGTFQQTQLLRIVAVEPQSFDKIRVDDLNQKKSPPPKKKFICLYLMDIWYMYMSLFVFVSRIYLFIEREREREKEKKNCSPWLLWVSEIKSQTWELLKSVEISLHSYLGLRHPRKSYDVWAFFIANLMPMCRCCV